jgi:hypothetical protein
MAEIFLSYSRANEEFMHRLNRDLIKAGFSVWVDQTGLERGSPGWKAKIQKEIERARCLVVVLSPEAKGSRWVEREISYAEAFDRPILAVLAKGNKRTAVPLDLMDTDWFDARRRYSRTLAELVDTIQGHLGKRPSSRTIPKTSPSEIRRRKVEEIIQTLHQSGGSGTVGRIRLKKGLLPAEDYAYQAKIYPTTSSNVLEASRQLEMRGWRLGDMFAPLALKAHIKYQTKPNFSSVKAYLYTWPKFKPRIRGFQHEEQERQHNEAFYSRIAEELVAANELLGEWPEDIEVNF